MVAARLPYLSCDRISPGANDPLADQDIAPFEETGNVG